MKTLQRRLHPDKHTQGGKEEQAHAAEHSARLNAGYSVLRHPLSRARYLVRRGTGVQSLHSGVGCTSHGL